MTHLGTGMGLNLLAPGALENARSRREQVATSDGSKRVRVARRVYIHLGYLRCIANLGVFDATTCLRKWPQLRAWVSMT